MPRSVSCRDGVPGRVPTVTRLTAMVCIYLLTCRGFAGAYLPRCGRQTRLQSQADKARRPRCLLACFWYLSYLSIDRASILSHRGLHRQPVTGTHSGAVQHPIPVFVLRTIATLSAPQRRAPSVRSSTGFTQPQRPLRPHHPPRASLARFASRYPQSPHWD